MLLRDERSPDSGIILAWRSFDTDQSKEEEQGKRHRGWGRNRESSGELIARFQNGIEGEIFGSWIVKEGVEQIIMLNTGSFKTLSECLAERLH